MLLPGTSCPQLQRFFLLKALTRGHLGQLQHQGFNLTDAEMNATYIWRERQSCTQSEARHTQLHQCTRLAVHTGGLKKEAELTAGNCKVINAMTAAVDFPGTPTRATDSTMMCVALSAAHLHCVLLLLKARGTLTPAQLRKVQLAMSAVMHGNKSGCEGEDDKVHTSSAQSIAGIVLMQHLSLHANASCNASMISCLKLKQPFSVSLLCLEDGLLDCRIVFRACLTLQAH
ncbi:hypothetical protein MMC29_001289 [Sticta canariensis]|nr:hypothetical protein [Sticta canariensis]